jgi:4-amino-4-deoxy-L-arabinose transferase-like glycosyltransferase
MFLRKIVSEHKWLLVILFFACLLRLFGIRFGLPYQYHPDEIKYVILALKVGAVGPNVGYFDNPTGFVYLLFFEYGLLYVIGRLFSFFHSSLDLAILYYQNPSIFYLLGRITSLILSVGTVWLTYTIAKKSFNHTIGLLAALFLACSFGHIHESHFAVPDISMVFFLILAFYFIVQFWQSETNAIKYSFLSGFFAGVAIGFKYTAGLILVPLVLAILFQRNKLSNNMKNQVFRGLGVFVCSFLGFFITCPYAILDYPKFWVGITNLQYMDKTGHFGLDPLVNGYMFYIQSLGWQLGWLIFISGIIGIGFVLYKHKSLGIIFCVFPILLYLFMGNSKLVYDRFMLPVLPFFAIASSVLLVNLTEKLKWRGILIPILSAIFIIQPLVYASYSDYLLTQKDTRTIAKDWVEQNIPVGSKIIMEGYSPPLTAERQYLQNWIPPKTMLEPYLVIQLPTKGAPIYPLSYYREQGYDYLIIASYTYLRYWVRPELNPEAIEFYKSLPQETKLVATFSPFRNNSIPEPKPETFPTDTLFQRVRPGPIIQIFALK